MDKIINKILNIRKLVFVIINKKYRSPKWMILTLLYVGPTVVKARESQGTLLGRGN